MSDSEYTRAATDSISHDWGLTEMQWLERVRSAEYAAVQAEAERDALRAALTPAAELLRLLVGDDDLADTGWYEEAEKVLVAARRLLGGPE